MQHETDAMQPYATNYATGFQVSAFAQRCAQIELSASIDQRFRLWEELLLLAQIVRAAWRGQTLLLCSSRGSLRIELLSSILIGLLLWWRRPPIVLYGEMYEPDGGLRGWLQRRLMRLTDHWIDRYIVFSQDECVSFAASWGVDPAKLRNCGYYHRPKPFPLLSEQGDYLFSGGNSFRNYAPLIEAAWQLPEQPLLIATKSLGVQGELPPNVQVCWPERSEWMHALATARACIVPIAAEMRRSVGLLLISEAMWLGKVVIVSDALGVREYVEDGVTGLVVDGTATGYVQALRWALDPNNAEAVALMGRRASQAMEAHCTLAQHTERLLSVLDELTDNWGTRRPTEGWLGGPPSPM